jgi:hypothetical protein
MKLQYIIFFLFIVNFCFCQNNKDSVNITTVWNAKSCGYKEICFPNFELLKLSFLEEIKKDTLILNFIDRPKDTIKGFHICNTDSFAIAYYLSNKENNLLQKNKTYLYTFTISKYNEICFNILILNIEKKQYFFKQENLYQFRLYKIINEKNIECNNCNKNILKDKKWKEENYNIL